MDDLRGFALETTMDLFLANRHEEDNMDPFDKLQLIKEGKGDVYIWEPFSEYSTEYITKLIDDIGFYMYSQFILVLDKYSEEYLRIKKKNSDRDDFSIMNIDL